MSTKASVLSVVGAVAFGLSVLLVAQESPTPDPNRLSAGLATVDDVTEHAFLRPIATLDAEAQKQYAHGRKMFDAKWVFFWFEEGQWGSGPTNNANACGECHINNGRGSAPQEPGKAHSMVVRLSVPGENSYGGPKHEPNYGDQFQTIGVQGVVAPEGIVEINWIEEKIAFADGEAVQLRRPEIKFKELNFGKLNASLLTSPRVAPPLVGMGLLEAVPEETVRALAARDSNDGIRGRVNEVWDYAAKKKSIGRFGHKANSPTIRQQIAEAFNNDIGVTSDYFPDQNCPGPQDVCRGQMPSGRPELGQVRWNAIEFHLRHAAVPARRNVDDEQVQRGEKLFAESQCTACHVPELKTGVVKNQPTLSEQMIHPYTDLLLHDMGEGLADNRPDYKAGGRDWRTAPLWGVGLTKAVNGVNTYLHDGRARSLTEAILWHGGEAEHAREKFRQMSKADRESLVRFLESL